MAFASNNEIEILDRLQNPGLRELSTIMKTSEAAQERVVFAINADRAKVHRRVKIRESDWGAQACKTATKSKTIWLNRTGTFGVSSAAYWWSRLMGLLGRHAMNLMGNLWFLVLVFVDDLHMAAGGKDRWRTLWPFIAAMEMAGTPFSYKKFRRGFSLKFFARAPALGLLRNGHHPALQLFFPEMGFQDFLGLLLAAPEIVT